MAIIFPQLQDAVLVTDFQWGGAVGQWTPQKSDGSFQTPTLA